MNSFYRKSALIFAALTSLTFASSAWSLPQREPVPTERERLSDSNYKRVQSFGNRIVRNGHEDVNQVILPGNVRQPRNLTGQIDNRQFGRETGLDLNRHRTLAVRGLDIPLSEIQVSVESDQVIEVPFYTSIIVISSSGIHNITLNVRGLIQLIVEQRQVQRYKVISYYESNDVEIAARQAGILHQYSSNFVEHIIQTIVPHALDETPVMDEVLAMVNGQLAASVAPAATPLP